MSTEVFFNYDAKFDDEQKEHLTELINQWQVDVLKLLPKLEVRDVVFDREPYSEDWQANGSSWGDKIVLNLRRQYLASNPEVEELRSIFFHESYHGVQKWFLGGPFRPIEASELAVNEGAAVMFEALRSGYVQPLFDYSNLDIESLTEEVFSLGTDFETDEWRFYHKEKGEPVLLYRVGSYIVNTALEKNPEFEIEDFATKNYEEILKLSGLQTS